MTDLLASIPPARIGQAVVTLALWCSVAYSVRAVWRWGRWS